MSQYLLIFAIAFVCCAIVGVAAIARQRHTERSRLARYTLSGREPQSIVCPKCARRSYSERAIRERYCPACKSHHDTVGPAPAQPGGVA